MFSIENLESICLFVNAINLITVILIFFQFHHRDGQRKTAFIKCKDDVIIFHDLEKGFSQLAQSKFCNL